MRRSVCFVALAVLCFLGLPRVTSTAAAAPEKSPEIEAFYPSQVQRGEATEITVRGKHFDTIQSVEITPPEGISVREIKEKQKGKAWTVVLVAGPDAQPGERSVVLVTPQGRPAAQAIRIPDNVPQIKEITVLSTKRSGGAVEFEANVLDEAGDLGPNPYLTVVLLCRNIYVLRPGSGPVYLSGTRADKVTEKDSKNSLVHASVSGYGISMPKRSCEIEVGIQDRKRNQSKDLNAPVEFK